jgi:hypothetical protein
MFASKAISLSIKQLLLKFSKGISKPSLLLKLHYFLKQMKKINAHYSKYPQDISSYEAWRKVENEMFYKIFSKKLSNN